VERESLSYVRRAVVGSFALVVLLPVLAHPAPAAARDPWLTIKPSVGPRTSAGPTTKPFATSAVAHPRPGTWTSATRWAAPSSPSAPTATPRTAQTAGPINILGDEFANNAVPPDSMGGVGPSQILVVTNGNVRTFSKTTGAADGAINESLNSFFGVAGSNVYMSDPRVRYDRRSGRWFITAIDVTPTQTDNDIVFAVSPGSTLTSSGWGIYSIHADANTFDDFDTLGVDEDALYVGANVFDGSGNLVNTNAYVIDKASLIGGNPVYDPLPNLIDLQSGVGPITPMGVDNVDSGTNQGYIVGVDASDPTKVDVVRISDPVGTPTATLAQVLVPEMAIPVPVAQPNGAPSLDGGMPDLSNAIVRNGQLWTSQTLGMASSGSSSGTNDRNGVRWYEIKNLSSTPAIVQSGSIFDPASTAPVNYWMPSIMVSGQGHASLGFSQASTNASTGFASVAIAGRLASDALNTLSAPVVAEPSTFTYNPSLDTATVKRWGDFSYTAIDPSDDMTTWTFQEYTSATDKWGVRVVQLRAPAPTFGSATSPHAGLATTPVTINGTGFFDPGAGFAKRLSASVTGGVTVNHVTSVSPTKVVLDVSTAHAAPGVATVQIKDPDGQTASGAMTVAPALPCVACSDFNADAKPDILYWNDGSGATDVWFMNGVTELSSSLIKTDSHGYPKTSWIPVGTGDFNADGKPDILYWNSVTGTTDVWYMSGTAEQGSAFIRTDSHGYPKTSWVPVATGDFNGDGKPDILYWNKTTGVTIVWYLNGVTELGSAFIKTDSHGYPKISWVPIATGDFNGDGKSDILYWNKTTGVTIVWYLNGVTELSSAFVRTDSHGYPKTSWVPVATGDFNGDTKPDILYWNTGSGVTVVWYMNGVTELGSSFIRTDSHGYPKTSWVPVA